jgi:hypothetical protein
VLKRILDNAYLVLLLRLLLGVLFIYASIGKITQPEAFARNIADYQILPIVLVNFTAIILPWLELICGLCLVFGFKVRSAVLLVIFLMLIFDFAVFDALVRGLQIRCGCFFQRTEALVSIRSLISDIILTICAIGLWVSELRRTKPLMFVVGGKVIGTKELALRFSLPVLVGLLLGLFIASLPFFQKINPFLQRYQPSEIFTTLPMAPSELTATAVSSCQVNLSWTDNSINDFGFYIERKAGQNGAYARVASISLINNNHTDTMGLQPSTSYYYRVCSHNSLGKSPYSNEVSVTTLFLSTQPPAGPTGLTAVPNSPHIKLIWQDNSGNEIGFRIERKLKPDGTYTLVASINADETSYLDQNKIVISSTYYYRLKAYNNIGESGYSNETNAPVESLSAPSDLKVSVVHNNLVVLSWNDNSANENGFKIERKQGEDGVYNQIALLGRNSMVYVDQKAKLSAVYYYRLRSFTRSEESAYSNGTSITTSK